MSIHYPFPAIRHISDVLPFIDDTCFRVVEKDGLTFINYNMMGPDTFPPITRGSVAGDACEAYWADQSNLRAAVRRECRGIAFDSDTGAIVSRPFHKFFNLGEREDVTVACMDLSRMPRIIEKLDGSMIRPLTTEFGIRWGTKMGITDVGMLAEEFVAGSVARGGRSPYVSIAEMCIKEGVTPIFEFCSPRARIVVDYPVETMVLLAIRDNVTGEYWDRWRVLSAAGTFGVPVVDYVDAQASPRLESSQYTELVSDIAVAADAVRASEVGEGKILVFNDGHAVKIKSDWYVRLHRAKDMLRTERRLVELIVAGELDDLLALLSEADFAAVQSYQVAFWRSCNTQTDVLKEIYRSARAQFPTKKDFALSDFRKGLSAPYQSMVFSMWDGLEPFDLFMETVRRGLSSETRWTTVKEELGLAFEWRAEGQEQAA